MYRHLAHHPRIDALVAYCSLLGVQEGWDPEFHRPLRWDIPLLDGYPWVYVPNRSPRPGLGRFWGMVNLGLWRLIRRGSFDVVVSYTGYMYASFWIALGAAKAGGVPFIMAADNLSLRPRDGKRWKIPIKRVLLPRVFRMPTVIIVPTAANQKFVQSLGIDHGRVVLVPSVVDTTWWISQADQVNRTEARRRWGIPDDVTVVLFCGKFQPWKRPRDVLQAFAKAGIDHAYLILVGDGPLRPALEAEARTLGIADRVRFLGFVSLTQLPSVYRTADICVVPSELDPCPGVVCEAMLCGCPVILSDGAPGRMDVVQHGETGFVYPCGDVDALTEILRKVLQNPESLREMGNAARDRVKNHSYQDIIDRLMQAVELAISLHSQNSKGGA